MDKAALDGIKKQAKVFQAIIDVADLLENIGSIDSATAEANRRLDAARVEEKNSMEKLKAVENEIAALTDKKASHVLKIEALVADAEARCKAKLQEANNERDAIVAEAKGQAKLVVSDAEARAAKVDAETQALRADMGVLLESFIDKRNEYDKLVKAIDALKSKFA